MKRSFLFAFALMVGVGGAFASNNLPELQKPVNSYTYYLENICDVPIVCSDDVEGPSCAEVYSDVLVYGQPGCQIQHVVPVVLGKLPN